VFSFGTTFRSGGNGFEGGLKLENSSIVSFIIRLCDCDN
jgi:hypothetical protein